MHAITVKTADKDNANAQEKIKWPISLVSVLKPLITVIADIVQPL